MGKMFEHLDEFRGGIAGYTPDTPQSRIDEEVHMEQRKLEDWERDNNLWGDFTDLNWGTRGQSIKAKVEKGNQLLAQLAEFQGGELRCFVCHTPMPSVGDNVRLHDFIRDQLESVGVKNLRFPEHGLVGLVDATHYGLHGLTDCANYNGINPTLEMVKVSPCDPHLESLPFGGVIAPALDSQEQCVSLIRGTTKRCGVKVALPTSQIYCPIHI